jgi:hypothetical protein
VQEQGSILLQPHATPASPPAPPPESQAGANEAGESAAAASPIGAAPAVARVAKHYQAIIEEVHEGFLFVAMQSRHLVMFERQRIGVPGEEDDVMLCNVQVGA